MIIERNEITSKGAAALVENEADEVVHFITTNPALIDPDTRKSPYERHPERADWTEAYVMRRPDGSTYRIQRACSIWSGVRSPYETWKVVEHKPAPEKIELGVASGSGGGYENAPATKLLATYCAACGRPLVDSVSVEVGLGPECRKRHGYNATAKGLSDEARTEANRLVYLIALEQTGIKVTEATARLRELGFGKLADRIEKRVVQVRIEEIDGRLAVKSPFDEEAVAAMKRIPGRRWNRDEKVNTFPVTSKGAIWELLKTYYPGALAVGPKGPFQVPA